MTTWLLIDGDYLCHRAYHAMGNSLFHEDVQTGVVFGFLRDILKLQNIHYTEKIVFAFDDGDSLRKKLLPSYKGNRKPRTSEEAEHRNEVHRQIELLKREYLPALGFNNVFFAKGYEADDIIASICKHSLKTGMSEEAIIVSADKDLYQLLDENVMMWSVSKNSMMIDTLFATQWGIHPSAWATVKAIAGCNTDCVPGVKGVAEKTAVKFLRGELKRDSAIRKAICEAKDNGQVEKNIPLVTLPFKNCPRYKLIADSCTDEKWNKLTRKLGMKSLMKGVRGV